MILLWATSMPGQTFELVPNGSFETVSSCPKDTLQLELSTPWFGLSGKSTLWAACAAREELRPPQGSAWKQYGNAYQLPQNGLNHAGFSNWTTFPTQPVEYIGVRLIQPLQRGQTGVVTFYAAPDVTPTNAFTAATYTNAIGAGLLVDTVGITQSSILSSLFPIAQLAEPLIDTAGWTKVSSCFTAKGGERYLVLGNMLPVDQVKRFYPSFKPGGERTYIYVDNVSLQLFDPYPDTIIVCKGSEVDLRVELSDYQISAKPCPPLLSAPCRDSSFIQTVTATSGNCVLRDTSRVLVLGGSNEVSYKRQKCKGKSISLSPAILGLILWEDGDSQPFKLVEMPGDYFATITNECGTTRVFYDVSDVDCDCEILAPNAFSPNNDGINDIFEFKTSCPFSITQTTLRIFDRWGGLLFEVKGDSIPFWDGSVNGVGLNVGVYVYTLSYVTTTEDGIVGRTDAGTIELIQ